MDVHPRISVNEECTASLSLTAEIDVWHELGVGRVGAISTKLEPFGWDAAADLFRKAEIQVSNIGTENHLLGEAIEFGAQVGAESVWVVSGGLGQRTWEQAASEFCEEMAPHRQRAAELGVQLAVEPTNSLRIDRSFLYTLRDTVDVARDAGVGVIFEIVMCWYERDLERLVREHVDRLSLAQLCDFQVGTRCTPDRAVLGDGDIPLERTVGLLLDAGYSGSFDLEILGPRIEDEGYASALRRSLEYATDLLTRLDA